VLGDPVAHSLSPIMHNAALTALGVDGVYVALRVAAHAFADTVAALAGVGVAGNVTVPHKEAAERCVSRKTELCAQAGACNTFWMEQGVLVGDNTDVPAIAAELGDLGFADGRWLVLGTGGSARAVALAAARAGAELLVRSRDAARTREFVRWARGLGGQARAAEPALAADVVINATPLGLEDTDPLPIDAAALRDARGALDLVYRAGETPWVHRLRAAGLTTRDGRGVLVRQGALAWSRFFPDQDAPVEIMRAAVDHALRG
jgi:shikimate dehydrogenase